ncbi:glycosyltransferase (plasmid) [Sphingomonas aurantiaca]
MVRIVHISCDHPDAWNAAKTPVIRDLVALVRDRFDHHVLSLNRVNAGPGFVRDLMRGASPLRDVDETGGVTAIRYAAPARGLFHATILDQLAYALVDRVSGADMIVGHKLTIEGLMVQRIAERLGIPYALSVQGNTDTRILSARPDLRARMARVWHGAAVAFPFTPWALARVEARLGRRSGPTILLPCPTATETRIAPRVTGGGILSAFHLRAAELKNAPRLFRAAARAAADVPRLTLAVAGGGTDDEVRTIRSAADRLGGGVVTLEGPVAHADMQARMHRAAGFAMPSLRESFGLVFVEALLAGCPILYPRGAAVDGYFDGLPFAIPVDARDTAAIACGLKRMVTDEAALKAALAQWQDGPGLTRFLRAGIARSFGDGLAAAAA